MLTQPQKTRQVTKAMPPLRALEPLDRQVLDEVPHHPRWVIVPIPSGKFPNRSHQPDHPTLGHARCGASGGAISTVGAR